MLDSFFLPSFFNIGKTDFSPVNRDIQRNFNELAFFQFFLYKFFNDTADSKTYFGEFDEKFHGGGLNCMMRLEMICGQVIINVLAGHVMLVQEHERTLFKKLSAVVHFFRS